MKRGMAAATLGVAALIAVSLAVAAPAQKDYCLGRGEHAVHMRAADGAPIYGVEVGHGSTGVVFGHQFMSDHCEWMDFARTLAPQRFRSIAIDFRGNGFSRGGNGPRLDLDVAAAVAHFRGEGVKRVVLVGSSMGGTAVLVAAARIRPAVAGVVSLSGPARYGGMDALAAVRASRVPVRFIADRKDGVFGADAQRLYHAAVARDKGIFLATSGLHGSSLLAVPRAKDYLLAFLSRQV